MGEAALRRKNGHGGRRDGAGRKRKAIDKHFVKQTVYLPPELARAIDQLHRTSSIKTRSAFIVNRLTYYLGVEMKATLRAIRRAGRC